MIAIGCVEKNVYSRAAVGVIINKKKFQNDDNTTQSYNDNNNIIVESTVYAIKTIKKRIEKDWVCVCSDIIKYYNDVTLGLRSLIVVWIRQSDDDYVSVPQRRQQMRIARRRDHRLDGNV